MKKNLIVTITLLIVLSACSPTQPVESTATATVVLPSPTATLLPTSTATPLPPTATPIPYTPLSSPLMNIPLEDLELVNTNPYDPPPLGFDEPHQGIDYAYYRYQNAYMEDNDGIEGLEVLSILDGTVISVINDRMPYGNALIIETPLEFIPPEWIQKIQLPSIQATIVPDPRHNCPELIDEPDWDNNNRSLYFVYAHLLNTPEFQLGDTIHSGQVIGQVGNTGNSSNAHLHLEMHLGPGGAIFPSMAKYDTRASIEEMANYCTWRISNRFILMDPNLILQVNQE